MGRDHTRVDLHLHSRASGVATNWWVKGLGLDVEARESYTPPEKAYAMAKGAGMDFVTLTDHETIDGALTLGQHADFFFGEEVSARFPGEESHVDVLVYGLDAAAHREVQARRGNVYELVDYLKEAGLVHVLAHPMYGMPGPLDRAQIEKRLVLFGLWEFVNGSRPARQNRLAEEVALGVGRIELWQMALRHGLAAPTHRRVSGTGGSDDHGGIYGGTTHTLVPAGIGSTGELLEALAAGEVRPAGEDGSVGKMAQTGLRLAGAAFEEGKQGASFVPGFVLGSSLLRRLRGGISGDEKNFLKRLPLIARMREHEVKAALSGLYEDRLSRSLSGAGTGFPALDILRSGGTFVDAHAFIAPYAGVHGYFGREANDARVLRRELFPERREELRVGVFVDGINGVNGVATMYRNLWTRARAASVAGDHTDLLKMVRCGGDSSWDDASDRGFRSLRAVAELPVPLYDEIVLGVPSLLEVLDLVSEEDFNVLHVATPGPLGLAALVAGLIIGVPVVGAYHTEFGAYARALSGDPLVAEIVEVAVREFYERCSAVAVPSHGTALALRNRGYRIRNYEVFGNGVDAELFAPSRRDPALRDYLGGGRTLLLYAGRVSREKGLDRLAAGYLALRSRRDDVRLVIAGDGPYRDELQALLGDGAAFTGFLHGEELARLYASCDVFVFPSTTDTLGRAVAEAQASGLPAVVYDAGGPGECILPGVSGFVVSPENEEELFARVGELLDDAGLRLRMGRAAREFAGGLSWDAVLEGLNDFHRRLAGIERGVKAAV